MSEQDRDLLFDLLTTKAIHGLNEAEEKQLADFDQAEAELEFRSLEMVAAAISMIGTSGEEAMPKHIFERILDDGDQQIASLQAESTVRPTAVAEVGVEPSSGSWFGWLGWAAAAAACIALVFNVYFTRVLPPEIAKTPPVEVERPTTAAGMRDELLRSGANVIKANWTSPDPKNADQVSGDVVWNEEKQVGYMRFRGLPVNDAKASCYQLWIFDKTQDEKTPIDGGTFDVNSDGEVIVPINAKLKAVGAKLFAITVEKPGGVVVSKREKIAAIAKVEI